MQGPTLRVARAVHARSRAAAADIAQIMDISEATVNFHARNVCNKLGTGNKTSAAVRAALMGLLW